MLRLVGISLTQHTRTPNLLLVVAHTAHTYGHSDTRTIQDTKKREKKKTVEWAT